LRTQKTIKNIISTFIPYILIGILGFIKVKVFVHFLNDDIYSLNQLFYQVLGYLSLVDSGFGLLIVQKLYKAFSDNNEDEINNIYSTAKIFFRNIGLIILSLGFIVSFFIHIFTKANISNFYIQIVFIIFVFRNIIDYFYSSPRYVIQADQKMYKINYLINVIRILQIISEIVLVSLGFDYLIILIPGIFISIIINVIINRLVYNEYPWLKDTKKYNKEYVSGSRYIISQKIAGIFHNNTDIVLLSTFIDPLNVVIYSSYNYICKFITDTSYMLANAVIPSFANAINDKKVDNKQKIFSELNMLFLFISSFVSIMLYLLLNPFISFWVGEKYVVSNFTVLLFIIITFRYISIRMMYVVINSNGLFKETKNIIISEAVINCIISVILIFKYGLNGVLIGTILSAYLTTFWFFPKYIYNNVFKTSSRNYFLKYLFVVVITFGLILLINFIKLPKITNIYIWLKWALIYAIIVLLILLIIYYICFKSFRSLFERAKYFLMNRRCKYEN